MFSGHGMYATPRRDITETVSLPEATFACDDSAPLSVVVSTLAEPSLARLLDLRRSPSICIPGACDAGGSRKPDSYGRMVRCFGSGDVLVHMRALRPPCITLCGITLFRTEKQCLLPFHPDARYSSW